MAKISKLWVERYRPKVVDDIIFKDDSLKQKFKAIVKSKEIPNLLLSGVQGSGKTTLSLAIVNECGIDPVDILTINGSAERGIDAMRDKVNSFSKTMPMGNFKVVRFEEMDQLTPDAQRSLRQIIEESSDTCRFICTCNYVNKIIPALKSRLQEYQFTTPDLDSIIFYVADILDKETVEFDPDLLEKLVNSAYPDIRKTVQILQQYSSDGILHRPDGASNNTDYRFKLIELVEVNDWSAARKIVCENIPAEEYEDLYAWLYQNIKLCPKFKDSLKEDQAIIKIADHLYKHALSAHPHITLASLFIELGKI